MSDLYPSDIGDFIIGLSPIGVIPSALPTGPVTVLNTIPAYPYFEYQNDDNIAPFFTAYNEYAQAYLDYLNNLNLPIYTNGVIVGPLLDWVAEGIYGITRPALPTGTGSPTLGPYNTAPLNVVALNTSITGSQAGFTAVSDDIFKRIITWFFYKGDGKSVSSKWLKRRINRFLNGANGADVQNDETYAISANWTGKKAWTITLIATPISIIFKEAVEAGVVELPFQIEWTVTLDFTAGLITPEGERLTTPGGDFLEPPS